MSENKEYVASFEIKEIAAFTLDEFIKKVEELTKDGAEVFNIVAVVATKKLSTISDFKKGDIVCLRHDVTKRFVVESNLIQDGRIQLSYFNKFSGVMLPTLVEPKYLMIAPKQG